MNIYLYKYIFNYFMRAYKQIVTNLTLLKGQAFTNQEEKLDWSVKILQNFYPLYLNC